MGAIHFVIRDILKLDAKEVSEFYKHEFTCDNCRKLNTMWIRKGRKIKDCVMEKCDNCGCYYKF